jgi:hypothetical protein
MLTSPPLKSLQDAHLAVGISQIVGWKLGFGWNPARLWGH